jgi:hypothetical protein
VWVSVVWWGKGWEVGRAFLGGDGDVLVLPLGVGRGGLDDLGYYTGDTTTNNRQY